MIAIGKLVHEGRSEDGDVEVFVFYGYNAYNGEPWRPHELRVKASATEQVEYLLEQCKLSEVTLELDAPVKEAQS